MKDQIIVKGARQHNLKNITVEIRQFLGQMDKPDVDYIEGLSPAISIDQKTTSRNPRSTVGTVTEIYDYLRLLFARIGEPHCPKCGKLIERQTVQQIVDHVLAMPQGTRFMVMAPLVRGRKGEHAKIMDQMRKAGYVRMFVDGEVRTLDEEIKLEKNKKHSLSVVIDRLAVRDGITQRLTDSVETALKLAEGLVEINVIGGETQMYSENFACSDCGISLPEIEPRLFSFNNPMGACPACTGLGMNMELDKSLIIPDGSKTFAEGVIAALSTNQEAYHMKQLAAVLTHYGYSLDTVWNDLPKDMQEILWYGSGEQKFSFMYENLQGEVKKHTTPFEGIIPLLRRRHREAFSERMRLDIESFMTSTPCPVCHGARLKPEVLSILVGGKNICEVTALTVRDAINFFETLNLTERQQFIARQILKEILARLRFLNDVGLDYLTLDRAAGTLSGGEAQRIRLATQIGSGLVGVLYILDEPSIGLHQRDNSKLLATLQHLRDLGNTLLVVEHDEETMYAADQIIDIGPGAGEHGGNVVAQGTAEEIKLVENSVTGQYLSGRKFIPVPKKRRECDGRYIEIIGAKANNLKNIDVKIPLGVFTVVTGVSGSGKSTLINDILYNALAAKLHGARLRPSEHKEIRGLENIDKIINIDQSPIGRTPRSNPATYTGVFDFIRELFSQTNEAKMRGYKPGRFSFNVKGGRCEACRGDGMNKIEMNFLPDVYVPCEVCHGTRYNSETLEDVGLGYIHLGQAATTLSGGEAQRVKLATELSRRSTGKTLYILDEPTTGLHIADVHKLLDVLQRLVEAGDSVVVIEHNLDVIKTADYLIDLGPEGGDKGGTLVACGTPEELAKVKKSYTGQYVKQVLRQAKDNGWYQ